MPRSPTHKKVADACRRALKRKGELGFEALDVWEQELIATLLMHEEIRNGGFHQWFKNPHSDHSGYAIGFLRRIGAHDRLELIQKALGYFPIGDIPTTQDERCAFVAQWTPEQIHGLDALNTDYYALAGDLYNDMIKLVPEGSS